MQHANLTASDILDSTFVGTPVTHVAHSPVAINDLPIWSPYEHFRIVHGSQDLRYLGFIDFARILRTQDQTSDFNTKKAAHQDKKIVAWYARNCRGKKPKQHTNIVHANDEPMKSITELLVNTTGSIGEAVNSLSGEADYYMSQNSFGGWRRANGWRRLNSFYLDFDDLDGCTHNAFIEKILRYCDQVKLPRPSYMIFSGRGINAVWLIQPQVRNYGSDDSDQVWKALELKLHETFKAGGFKPDPAVQDISRVLRLSGTVNSKSGKTVRPIFINGNDKRPIRYHIQQISATLAPGKFHDSICFRKREFESLAKVQAVFFDNEGLSEPEKITYDYNTERLYWDMLDEACMQSVEETGSSGQLFDAILKKARGTASKTSKVVHDSIVRPVQKKLSEFAKRVCDGASRRSGSGYYNVVLKDLYKLAAGRGGVSEGYRDKYLFIAICAAAHCLPAEQLPDEIKRLGELVGFDEKTSMDFMSSALKRACRSERGETMIWEGKVIDPKYRFKAETIANWLDVTQEEMTEYDLRAIIDDQRRKEIDRARKAKKRNQVKLPEIQKTRLSRIRERNHLIADALSAGHNKSIRLVASMFNVSIGTVASVKKTLKAFTSQSGCSTCPCL